MVVKQIDDYDEILSNQFELEEGEFIIEDGYVEEFIDDNAGDFDANALVETDAVSIYMADCRQTILLNAEQEKALSSDIELRNELTNICREFETLHGRQPSVLEITLVASNRIIADRVLFERLYHYLELPAGRSLAAKFTCPELRSAIDGR
jgi:hypothetical protein